MQAAETGPVTGALTQMMSDKEIAALLESRIETIVLQPPSRQQRRAMARSTRGAFIASIVQKGTLRRKTRRMIARKSRQRNRR